MGTTTPEGSLRESVGRVEVQGGLGRGVVGVPTRSGARLERSVGEGSGEEEPSPARRRRVGLRRAPAGPVEVGDVLPRHGGETPFATDIHAPVHGQACAVGARGVGLGGGVHVLPRHGVEGVVAENGDARGDGEVGVATSRGTGPAPGPGEATGRGGGRIEIETTQRVTATVAATVARRPVGVQVVGWGIRLAATGGPEWMGRATVVIGKTEEVGPRPFGETGIVPRRAPTEGLVEGEGRVQAQGSVQTERGVGSPKREPGPPDGLVEVVVGVTESEGLEPVEFCGRVEVV